MTMQRREESRPAVERTPQSELSLCSMSIGNESFGIDTSKVREVLGRAQTGAAARGGVRFQSDSTAELTSSLRCVPLAPRYIAGVMPYRGDVLTTLSFRALLGRKIEETAGRKGLESGSGGCVLVLDDGDVGELLGLIVDRVGGVVTVQESMLEPNPCTLDERSRALFAGVYKTPTGLIVRIDPAHVQPAYLAASGLFDDDGLQETRGGKE